MSGFSEYFEACRRALLAARQTSIHPHPSLAGAERELFIREFLEKHIPPALHIGTGLIFGHEWASSGTGQLSRQQDIIIHRGDMPMIRFRGSSLYFVESVVATIEVKTHCGLGDLAGVFTNAHSFETLARVPSTTVVLAHPSVSARPGPNEAVPSLRLQPRRILKVLLAYGSADWRIEYLPFLQQLAGRGLHGPDLIYFLDRGLIIRSGEIDVLENVEHQHPALWDAMNSLTEPLQPEEAVQGAYRRAFDNDEAWRGLELLVLELAERCQRYASVYDYLVRYCSVSDANR